MPIGDRALLRELGKQYWEISQSPEMDSRRELWRDLHEFRASRPPIHVRQYAFHELPQAVCFCGDPLHRALEYQVRDKLYAASLGDDTVFEPWLSLRAVFLDTDWGVALQKHESAEAGGSYKIEYALGRLEDWPEVLRPPKHRIDEALTKLRWEKAIDALDGVLPIDMDRSPYYNHWHGDLSSDLGKLRGMENFMVDMYDNPEELHRLMAFFRDSVLRVQRQADDAMDWRASASLNQASPYARGLADPACNTPVRQSQLWGFLAAQEFTGVSPDAHDEFLLAYQMPILERFKLTAYGCCEDLSRKIGMLRKIPNLRRIAVTPFADVRACAEQIGTDYVVSYRPSPADMVSYGFDEGRIRGILSRDLSYCKGCSLDITLKDVETVQGDPQRVRDWVALARAVIDELY